MKEYAKCENSFRTQLAFSVALDLPILFALHERAGRLWLKVN